MMIKLQGMRLGRKVSSEERRRLETSFAICLLENLVVVHTARPTYGFNNAQTYRLFKAAPLSREAAPLWSLIKRSHIPRNNHLREESPNERIRHAQDEGLVYLGLLTHIAYIPYSGERSIGVSC
jgi:hypothetical protein